MAYVSPIKTAQEMTAKRLVNERAQQLISQSEKAEPLKIEGLRLANKVIKKSLKPDPMSVDDQERIRNMEITKTADFFHSLANAPSEFERHAIISNKMHEAKESGDPQKWANAQRFYAMSAEEQDQIGVAFFESPGYLGVAGGQKRSPSSTIQESQRIAELSNMPNRNPGQEAELSFLLSKMPPSAEEEIQNKIYEIEAIGDAKRGQALINTKAPGTPEYEKAQEAIQARIDLEAEKAEEIERRKGVVETNKRYANVVTQDIDRALEFIDNSPSMSTGFIGALINAIPGTDAYKLDQLLQPLRASISFNRLDEMRKASPTGGALGQVSELEIKLLGSVMGSFEQGMGAKALRFNLQRAKDVFAMVVNGDFSGETLSESERRDVMKAQGESLKTGGLKEKTGGLTEMTDEELDSAIEAKRKQD